MHLRYDGFDNQVLDCLPYMNMIDINTLHITPKSFQTPIRQNNTGTAIRNIIKFKHELLHHVQLLHKFYKRLHKSLLRLITTHIYMQGLQVHVLVYIMYLENSCKKV